MQKGLFLEHRNSPFYIIYMWCIWLGFSVDNVAYGLLPFFAILRNSRDRFVRFIFPASDRTQRKDTKTAHKRELQQCKESATVHRREM